MCAIFTWVHTGQSDLNGTQVAYSNVCSGNNTKLQSENAVMLPEIQRISPFHSAETFKSGQISIENIPTAIHFTRSINLKSHLVGAELHVPKVGTTWAALAHRKKSQALWCESSATSRSFQKNPSGKGVISRNKTRWNRLRNVPKILCKAKTAQPAQKNS